MNSLQQTRLKIRDLPTIADSLYIGDGSAQTFILPHRNLTSATAFVPAAGGWSATAAAFNPSGLVEFSGLVSAGSAFRVRYVHSVFSDADITQWIDNGGVEGAAVEAVTTLMFDGLKRARWASPDGTSYSDVEALTHLKTLYDALKREQADTATAAGSLTGW